MTELHNHLLKISSELGKAVDLEKIDIKTAVNLNAMLSEAINFIPCCDKLSSINSNTFKNYLEIRGYTETLNPLVYKKQGFEYDKEILHRHFLNELEFGNQY